MRAAVGEPTARDELRLAIDEWTRRSGHAAVTGLSLRRSNYATSAAVLNVHVTLGDGRRLRMVYKRTDPDALIPAARGVKALFLHDPEREIWVYQNILAGDCDLAAPALYASGGNSSGRRWLLLERVPGIELAQVGDRRVWCAVAAWLGRLHARNESRVQALPAGAPVRWSDPAFQLRWAQRAERFMTRSAAEGNGLLAALAPLWPQYPAVAESLAALPATIVHGDFNASNVMVSRDSGAVEIRAIDWEMAGIGPGLIDLAALVSGGWSDAERAAMVAAYRSALGDSQIGRMDDAAFASSLDLCRLALAVQWLGWSPNWAPPPRHAHGWGLEALQLARRLRLLG
ncbi:MAG TPA: aminoglycoside phosphotransferase family protein [Candidatus Solibacter sp.]|nr:aminoglycoside phosphotransferase family protein [Candidatus Solibacter sp.]